MPSVLFACNHCYLDFASGATISMRELFYLLGRRGWRRQVLCGHEFDSRELNLKKVLQDRKISPRTWTDTAAPPRYAVHRLDVDETPVVIFDPANWQNPPTLAAGFPFIQLLDRLLAINRPDVMLTFGGGWMGRAVKSVAARHGVPVVFWLRNDKYKKIDLFDSAAGVIVPSPFLGEHYRQLIGLECDAIPSPIRPERVFCPNREPRFVTFVGALPDKGVFYFARIASELGRQRPDIPVLVVAGRGNIGWLRETGMNLHALPNFKVMGATPDPRNFLRVTRVLAAPSLWKEAFMRVPVEGMLNGIPTLASRRGGLPGTLGDSGFLFDIPEHYTPAQKRVPDAAEVAPWVSTLIRLWDDTEFYKQQCERSRAEGQRYRPEVVVPMHEAVLERAIRANRPPAAALPPLAEDLVARQPAFAQQMGEQRLDDLAVPDDFLTP
jgi:glycosyltransferase involved in cell wall biosynthesis